MRVHHIPVRRNTPVTLPAPLLEQLPPSVCLALNAQFLNQLDALTEQIERTGRTVLLYQARHTNNPGQILGCSTDVMDAPAFLFVGEGLFHPQALAYANNAPVFLYDPVSGKTGQVDRSDIDARKKRREAGIKTFYAARNIGVLLSTKSGQKDEIALKRLRQEFPDKQFYVFLANTLNLTGLEDFPFIELWLNTACPRIGYDDIYKTQKPLINAEDVLSRHRF
jgi:2-(3-amino-3-carboxypropyl)histidine synthase